MRLTVASHQIVLEASFALEVVVGWTAQDISQKALLAQMEEALVIP